MAGEPHLRQMTFLYRAFHYVVIPVVLRLWTRLRVEGREHLPADGPLIVVSNHVDNWDSYLVGVFARDRVVNFLARADGLESRWLGQYWRRLGAIPADREGLSEALRILKDGGAIGIFPEGTISPTLVRAIPGSALLALRSGATVVPAAVWGTEHIRLWSILRPPRARGRDSQIVADELMCEVAALLPAPYRGVYADANQRTIGPTDIGSNSQ